MINRPKPLTPSYIMNLSTHFSRLSQLDQLLQQAQTGPPQKLAQQLGISLRAWHEFKDQLREDLGLPIVYSRQRQTYYYEQRIRLKWGFERKA